MTNRDEKDLFKPMPVDEDLRKFFERFPDAPWQDVLHYVLDRVPQEKDGSIQWVLEGGAAVKLLVPKRREPRDIDIITISDETSKIFRNFRKTDSITLPEWFRIRNLQHTPQNKELLLNNIMRVKFEGRGIVALNPLVLAVSKMGDWTTLPHPKRPKDIADIDILGVPWKDMEAMMARFKSEGNS